MSKFIKKGYFDIIFSWFITVFTALLIIGQIVFLTISLTIGIADWGVEGALAIGFGAFGLAIAIALSLTLFGAWRYWAFDEDGVTNGNLFHKRKLLFAETESIETKTIVIGTKPFTIAQENICFSSGKKTVTIPIYCLSQEELEWLKSKKSSMSRQH